MFLWSKSKNKFGTKFSKNWLKKIVQGQAKPRILKMKYMQKNKWEKIRKLNILSQKVIS